MATLIITEKPQSASKISFALSSGNAEKKSRNKAPWYEYNLNGEHYYVAPAVGHLFSLEQKGKGFEYPEFDIGWIPTFQKDKSAAFSKKYYDNLKKIASKCDKFVVACDYDIEGDVISFNILRFICGQNDSKRMKFSTLTVSELKNSFSNLLPHMDSGQVNAGLLRHTLDWYWGINTSRALMSAVKANNRYMTMSIGRVQGPGLHIVYEREMEIKKFKPTPYWQILLVSGALEALYKEKKIWDKKTAVEIYEACLGKLARVDRVERNSYNVNQPTPFNLTDLQKEAYRLFKISPSQTLKIAQGLYLNGLISYPRTSSQKLPPSLNYKKIVEDLGKNGYSYQVSLLKTGALKPREGGKSDPAHPAIHPTGNKVQGLEGLDFKVYDLIVKRFLACFSIPCKREKMNIYLKIGEYIFVAEGSRTLVPGWIEIYAPYSTLKEEELPALGSGQILEDSKLDLVEKETLPPKRYTPASLVSELEKRNVGTKTTRAEVIESLYSRKYIQKVPIEVTDLGIKVIETLDKYSPEIISEELTRNFEEEMEEVREGKKDKDKLIKVAKKQLEKILDNFRKHEKEIGKALIGSIDETRKKERVVGNCPSCGKELRVIVSKATRKRFVGCSGYAEGCKTSYPLPQMGMLQTTKQVCKTCSAPIVKLISKGRKPWIICINMQCPSKEKKNKN